MTFNASLGTILTGLFVTSVSTMKGVLYGGGFKFLGVCSVIAWTAVIINIAHCNQIGFA